MQRVLADQVVKRLHGRGSRFSLRLEATSNLGRAPVEAPGEDPGPAHQKGATLVELPPLHGWHIDHHNAHVGGRPDHLHLNRAQGLFYLAWDGAPAEKPQW